MGQSEAADPASLAAATAQIHAAQPYLLPQMFAPMGTYSDPTAKAALLGIVAIAARQQRSARR